VETAKEGFHDDDTICLICDTAMTEQVFAKIQEAALEKECGKVVGNELGVELRSLR
jgi:hypothetical protein